MLILILALVRLLGDELAANEEARHEQRGEAMANNWDSATSMMRRYLGAFFETVWEYGVGVTAARPLPGKHMHLGVSRFKQSPA